MSTLRLQIDGLSGQEVSELTEVLRIAIDAYLEMQADESEDFGGDDIEIRGRYFDTQWRGQ